jgi:hypothetical protein
MLEGDQGMIFLFRVVMTLILLSYVWANEHWATTLMLAMATGAAEIAAYNARISRRAIAYILSGKDPSKVPEDWTSRE